MNAIHKLDQYLAAFATRLRTLTLLKGAAATALVLLLVSGIGAWFSAESGFASTTTNVFRVVLVLALAAVILLLVIDPLQKLKSSLSRHVEKRVPDFNGRIDTYAQMKESNNPFIELLAEDTLKISDQHPVGQEVRQKELSIAAAILAAILAIFLYLLIAGPGMLNFGLRNLLAGWAFSDLLPPQTITVTPGDESVRRGSNVRITSVMEGFNPDDATIHIQNTDGEWQEVAMVQGPLGFEFTFFSMQQDLNYYISSTGLRSPEYDISVVDVPGIEKLELTYHYPEWTSREPETVTTGDVDALLDTRIDLKVTTTSPLTEGQLVLNSTGQPLTLSGLDASTNFTVLQEGEYHIAAIVGGEQVRISDDYFIRLTEDGKPVIELVRPGGDYNASSIEEVLARVEASDDYGLDKVALQFSVNGGAFESVTLGEGVRELASDHLFMLEDMTTVATPAVETNVGEFEIQLTEDESVLDEPQLDEPMPDQATTDTASAPAAAEEEQRIPLQPGDIISFYAEATDRSQTIRTDMFFIQIQPFDRRYSQSQLSGGGGGGQQQGGPQDEISQRQRQIIVSTWNLIREQAEAETPTQVEINSKLLSELQTTLAEQAATLVERTRARQLADDEEIEEFINNMEQAVQRMHPASAKLADVALNDAIQPAQEALQYLLRAESVFNDITVNQQQGGGGGGGGRASQDLAEMFELEMDLSLNQYETGNNASQQSQQQQAEDIMQQLDELAKRQEQLANNMRNQQQLTEAQRYQQEMLRREAEKLQDELEQLQRQQLSRNSQQQQGQQGQQGQEGQQGQQGQGQQGQSGQGGQQGQAGQGGQQGLAGQGGEQQQDQQQPQQNGGQAAGQQEQQADQVAQSELQRRMESAIRAMQQAQEAMQGNLSPEEMQRAAQEAQRQLEGASDQIAQDQLANMQQSFANMAERSADMVRDQERMARQLQEAMETAVKERESGEDPNSRGMGLQEEWTLAKEKTALAGELRTLQQQMLDAAQNFGDDVPEAGNELQRASTEVAESELEQAINDAALYIDAGYGLYIAGNESAVTNAMRKLADRLEAANAQVQGAGGPGNTDLDRARQQAQDLRDQLQQLAQGGQQPGEQQEQQPGQGQSAQQGQEEQEGQEGQEGQQGQASPQGQQGNQQAGTQPGNANGGARFGNRGGAWNGNDDLSNAPIDLPDNFYDNVDSLTQLARDAVQQMELNPEELAQMYDLIRELEYTRVDRNQNILAAEYGEMLALIEQLEVGLQTSSDSTKRNNVRTATSDAIPEEYRDSVAEYFRRLSRD
jgi:hypothetical protein